MDQAIEPVNRRTVLQRGLAFLAGVMGMDVIEARANAQVPESLANYTPAKPATTPQTLRLYAQRWQTHAHGIRAGELPAANGRMNRQGRLLDRPDGQKAGEYYTTCFMPSASFGGQAGPGMSIELHTFQVGGDMLFGMGSCSPLMSSDQPHAILGGTGRFAGSRGSYVVKQCAAPTAGAAEILVTFIS